MAGALSNEVGPSALTNAERLDWVGRPKAPPTGAFVGIAGGAIAEEARALEYDVFAEQGYCEASADGRVAEYAAWEDHSRFHVVLTSSDELIAMEIGRASCRERVSSPV